MPVVARLHGAVIGAGLELAAACARRACEWGLVEEAASIGKSIELFARAKR